jgi:hypothetical protein
VIVGGAARRRSDRRGQRPPHRYQPRADAPGGGPSPRDGLEALGAPG